MKTGSYVYLIGSACILLADLLSDEENMKKVRNEDMSKFLKRLKEIKPELRTVGAVSLASVKISGECERFSKRVTRKSVDQIEKERIIENMTDAEVLALYGQVAQSSEYMESWLTVFERIPETHLSRLNELMELAIKQVKQEIAIEEETKKQKTP